MSRSGEPAPNKLAVPYGSAQIRREVLARLAHGQFEDLERPGAPVAIIEASACEPLRLNTLSHPFTRAPVAQDLAHAATQLAFLEQHLVGLCDAWARPQRAFIAHYFAALHAHVAAHAADLSRKTGPLAGLVEVEHWCFAAPMPLPRAHLLTRDQAPLATASAGLEAGDFVTVDFAFWTGTRLLAVLVDSGSTLTSARRRQLARLEQAGIGLTTIKLADADAAGPTALLSLLGEGFESFWSDCPLPYSPFRGRGLTAPQPA